MSVSLFRFWSRDKVLKQIIKIEEKIADNVASASHSGAGGSAAFGRLEEDRRNLRALYARLDEIDGKKPSGPGMAIYEYVPR